MIKEKKIITLKRVTIQQWRGVRKAAKALEVTPTHVSRHINSEPGDVGYSVKLAARMEELRIVIEK